MHVEAVGECADYVVSLYPLLFEHGNIHGREQTFKWFKLSRKLLGHGTARRLVAVVHLMSECRRLQIECNGHIFRLDVA